MTKLKILVACEYSGTVRDAFRRRGHDAVSCDILESESPGPHIRGDVLDVLDDGWDMMIAHPPCTYLCLSGALRLYDSDRYPHRWDDMRAGAEFFRKLLNADIPRICVENPIPHRHGMLPRYSQIIQPWQHGHGETKATCLWLRGLPRLEPTKVVSGRRHRILELWSHPDRSKIRSRTYPGIAEAMASQWENPVTLQTYIEAGELKN